jgi:hypothetical protein
LFYTSLSQGVANHPDANEGTISCYKASTEPFRKARF